MIRRHPRSPLFPYTTLFRSMRSSTTKKPCMNVLNSKYSARWRSEEHTSELQSLRHLVCRLLLEKKAEVLAPRPATCSQTRRHIPTPRALRHSNFFLESPRQLRHPLFPSPPLFV